MHGQVFMIADNIRYQNDHVMTKTSEQLRLKEIP